MKTGKVVGRFGQRPTRGVDFTSDGNIVVVASEGEESLQAVSLHSVQTGKRLWVSQDKVKNGMWNDCVVTPNGQFVIVGGYSESGPLLLLDATTGNTVTRLSDKEIVQHISPYDKTREKLPFYCNKSRNGRRGHWEPQKSPLVDPTNLRMVYHKILHAVFGFLDGKSMPLVSEFDKLTTKGIRRLSKTKSLDLRMSPVQNIPTLHQKNYHEAH